jgi:hypothetical protein
MATEFWMHDGTQFRKAKEIHVHDGTQFRKAKEVWMHDGTQFRKVYQGFQVVIGSVTYDGYAEGTTDSEFPYTSDQRGLVRVILNTDGSGSTQGWIQVAAYFGGGWSMQTEYTKNWGSPLLAGIGSAYHVRLRQQSGQALSFGTDNVWYALTSQVYWDWWYGGGINPLATFYLDISADGGSTTLATSPLSTASLGWNYI